MYTDVAVPTWSKTGLFYSASLAALAAAFMAQPASAQAPSPNNLVSVCSGVSLPPSVVTDILSPVVTGITGATEARVNQILGIIGIIPIVGQVLPPLNTNATGLLNNAAAGEPISLRVLSANGTIIGPGDPCISRADGYTLADPMGIAVGGNQITGLGNGLIANSGEINSIAFGNGASTSAAATGAIAIGTNASVTGANSVAIGTDATAIRGPQANYAALGLTTLQNSVGEFSVGGTGAERQVTNVAAGSAATDAVNVGQLQGVANSLTALDDIAVKYNDTTRTVASLAGAGGTTLTNVQAGALNAGSTDAVNGSQLFATNQNVATNTTNIGAVNSQVTLNTTAITNVRTDVTNGAIGTVQYADAASPTTPNGGVPSQDLTLVGANAGPVGLHNVAAGTTVTDAVNLGQLQGVADSVTALDGLVVKYDNASRTSASLAGAGGTALTNLRAGALNASSTDAVNGSQLFETNQNVATNTTNIGALTTQVTTNTTNIGTLNTQVATNTTNIGTLNTQVATNTTNIAIVNNQVAVNTGNIATNTTTITNLRTDVTNGAIGTVQYSDASSPTTPNGGIPSQDVTLVGANAGPVALHNVAAGTSATDAVNVAQLQGVADTITGLDALAVKYDDATRTVASLGGAGGTTLTNLRAGALSASSTDAVNGSQLFATNQNVATNTANIATLGSQVVTNTSDISTLNTQVATNTTNIGTLTGQVAINTTNIGTLNNQVAVNTAGIAANTQQITVNTGNIAVNAAAITTLRGDVVSGAIGPVQYSSAGSPTTPNGGTPSQDLTLVGAGPGSVGLHNVAAGALGAGSTDAVNGGQLAGLGASVANILGGASYNSTTNTLTGNFTFAGDSYATVQTVVNAIEQTIVNIPAATNYKYIEVNSTMLGSSATGADATAIGPKALATGDGSFAAGRNTVASGEGSVAIGDGSTAQNGRAVAIGFANVASGNGAVAIGDPNVATGDGAVALGRDNTATGTGTVTLGNANLATGNGAIALGDTNNAAGAGAVAIGANNVANGGAALAIGSGNAATGTASLAVGNAANASGAQSVALGNGATASTTASLALGTASTAAHGGSVALGAQTQTTRGAATGYAAFGASGAQASAGEIAVGRNVAGTDPVTGVATPVGDRQVTGVAAGSANNDAANVGQLRGVSAALGTAVATGLGGGASYNATDGSVTGPSYNLGGSNYNNVGDALQALAAASGTPGATDPNAVRYTDSSRAAIALAPGGTTISNVAAGAVNATSTQAVNGAQLAATNQVANQALAVAGNSVQYDNASRTSVTFGPADRPPVTLSNIANGVRANDAVNVGQLNSALSGAIGQANAYTDIRITELSYDLRKLRNDGDAGTAGALAVAALPQAYEAGKSMIAIGGGTNQGESAFAFGFSKASPDGHIVIKAGATYNSRGKVAGNAGVGYQF